MSSEDLKQRVLAARMPKGPVEIPNVGTLTVRGMSRAEIQQVNDLKIDGVEADTLAKERWTLSRCVIDPQFTEDEIGVWQENSPAGEINPVALEINRLSGIGQAKERFPQV